MANKVDYFETTPDDAGTVFNANWEAQTFTASATYTATSVYLKLAKLGSPGTVTGGLYATSGGSPTGSALATFTLNGNNLPTIDYGISFVEYTLSVGVTLSYGSTYAIVLDARNADISGNQYVWDLRKGTGGYSGGQRFTSTNSGSTWSSATGDWNFQIYGTGKPRSVELELDSSQYLSITDAAQTGLALTNDFTIEAWIKFESLPSSDKFIIVAKDDTSGND